MGRITRSDHDELENRCIYGQFFDLHFRNNLRDDVKFSLNRVSQIAHSQEATCIVSIAGGRFASCYEPYTSFYVISLMNWFASSK